MMMSLLESESHKVDYKFDVCTDLIDFIMSLI